MQTNDKSTNGVANYKLDDYVALGYTPEGLQELLKHGEELAEELQKYKQAEAENRLIILPVASNMNGKNQRHHIFCDGAVFSPHCAGEIKELDHWYYELPMIYQDFRGEHDFVLDPDAYNKTWFTDRDACKKYLDEKYGYLNDSDVSNQERSNSKMTDAQFANAVRAQCDKVVEFNFNSKSEWVDARKMIKDINDIISSRF